MRGFLKRQRSSHDKLESLWSSQSEIEDAGYGSLGPW